MPLARALATTLTPLRRLALVGLGVAAVLTSCGREPTAPTETPARFARGLTFTPMFPSMQLSGSAADLVAFSSVHVVLHHTDGTIALDTTIAFPADSQQIVVSLTVKLAASAPSTGEPMTLDLGYLNAQGVVVFKGGPVSVLAAPSLPGAPPPVPVQVPVVYTGPGAGAKKVVISPRSLSVNAGSTFSFTAVALDASNNVVPNTPFVWTSLDPAKASIPNNLVGSGTALARGTARIVAQLVSGAADTVQLSVQPVPSTLAMVSGSGQSGIVAKPTPTVLAQPLVVKVTATDGLPVSGVSVSFGAGSGSGSVSPTTTTTDANGNAQTSWTLGNTVGAQTVSATSGSLTGSPVTFSATGTAAVATKLVLNNGPAANANITSGAPLGVTVTAVDVDGDPVVGFNSPVTVTLTGNAAGGILAGTATVNAVNGVASFAGLSIAKPGSAYVITASATGLTGVSTPAFNIVTGPPSSMVLVVGGGQSAPAGTQLSPITVALTDGSGNAVTGTTVTFAVATGGGSVTPASASTNSSGRATTTWTLGPNAGTQTIVATATGVQPLTVSATATSTTNHWVFSAQPTTQTSGAGFSVSAQLQSPANAVVTSFNGASAIALGANPGASTLGGTATVNAVAGVATFSGLTLDKVGTGYTLSVSSSGAIGATTNAFNVVAGPAAVLALHSGNNQTGTLGQALAQPIIAQVTDANGNAVAGTQVTFTVASGGGSVTPQTGSTNSSGFFSTTWTLGASGAQSLTVASTGLTGSPITVTATTGPGAIVKTVLTPNPDTLTSIGGTQQLTAQGLDANNTPVSGTWTYVSRNTAIATVNASGLVTSVANGQTYVVATETGGSKDSSLTVVQQRIATINVTPANRSLYTGGTFTFTAQAVDGNNVALATQPTFTWSSTSPSVATVTSGGVVTAVSIGTSQIKATSGASTGVSNLTVKSPILTIDVTYDSTGAPAPDSFTLTALSSGRAYRAIARDTLNNVMTGITFTWSTSNPSVAVVDTAQPQRAHVTASANGTTTVRAMAQGVVGQATLNVAQSLSSIVLTPATATVAINGTTSLLARGKDANGFFIPGGSFTFTSAAPAIATVNATSGQVTGVANGQTTITAASGTITSNTSTINVNSSGPAIISFASHTIGIGRGTAQSIPVLLSRPAPSAGVTVKLAVRDTNAFFSTAAVTILAGQSSVNATLNAKNAGTTFIYATDSSGTGFAGDTAQVNVQANIVFANNSYSLDATDQLSTQVLLSDPSPPGGTYVSYTYSPAGRAVVSPDPAFVPAGQLAANVVISGVSGGSLKMTPTAAGVNGTAATLYISTANLQLSGSPRVGAGQYLQNQYVALPNYRFNPLNVTLTSSDTNVVVVPQLVTVPTNSYYVYFNINARNRGAATVTASATGWTSATLGVVTTTPMVTTCCNNTLQTTSPQQAFYVYSADSTRNTHPRSNSLAVRVSSLDSTVMKVLDTLVTIPAGQYYTTARIIPGGNPGSTYIKATASGHTADSSAYTVNGPALYVSYANNRVGAGQQDQNLYVYIPNTIASPLTVTLTHTDSTKVGGPVTVTIPTGSTYAYFTLRGKVPGTDTITYTSPGYSSTKAATFVTTPKVRFSNGGTLNAYSTTTAQVYSADSLNNAHYRTASLNVSVRSADTTIIKIDTSGTIAAGTYYLATALNVTATGTGTAWVYVTAPGQLPDSVQWTVQPAHLNLSWGTYTIGKRQHRNPTDFYVYTPNSRPVSVPVTLTQKRPTSVQLSTTTPTIVANTNYAYFTFSGLTQGVDTVTATASNYVSATGIVRVTTSKLFTYQGASSATTTSPPTSLTIYATDSLNNAHYTMDTVTVKAVSSNPSVVQPESTYFHIIKDAYYASPRVIYTGVGSATITYSDSANSGYLPVTTGAFTVTGPALTIAGGSGMLGMRQQTSSTQYYVYTPNTVGTPLTVNLVSTDTTVATVPASVVIPANQNYAYFTITARDTIGTIQIQATATGYSATSVNMQVTQPRFTINWSATLNTTSPPSTFYVYATDQNGSSHYVSKPVTVILASSAPGVATIDSASITIPVGAYYAQAAWYPKSVGTAQLSASDTTSKYYKYNGATANVAVQTPTPSLSFTNLSLGIGQYDDHNVYLPNYVTGSPNTVTLSHAATPHTTTPASVSVAVGTSYQTFRVTGTSTGSDTITVAPTGHNAVKGAVNVGLGRVDPIAGWPSSLLTGDSTLVTIYSRDVTTNTHYEAAATTFNLASNGKISFVSGGATSTAITSVVIPAGAYYVQFWVKGVSAGTATITITNANYTTYTNSLTVQ